MNISLDIMVDIETGGLAPDRNAMIQLAAVPFDLRGKTIDAGRMFCRSLALPNNRFWDENTREWWSHQKPGLLAEIQSSAAPPADVMSAFAAWCREQGPTRSLRFWSRPLSFDYPFVSSYLRDFGYDPGDLIPHYQGRDVHSYLLGLGVGDPRKFVKDTPFEGDAHNALFDCLHAISALFRAWP